MPAGGIAGLLEAGGAIAPERPRHRAFIGAGDAPGMRRIDPSNRTLRNFNGLHQVYKLYDELFGLGVLREFDLHL
jgi:hypothetical protein